MESNSAQETVIGGVEEIVPPEIVNDVVDPRPATSDKNSEDDLSYYLRLSVSSSTIENIILSHPGVSQVSVRGVKIDGVGQVPRALVVIKHMVKLSREELFTWVDSRLDWSHKLRGGLVIVDKIEKNIKYDSEDIIGNQIFTDWDKIPAVNKVTTI